MEFKTLSKLYLTVNYRIESIIMHDINIEIDRRIILASENDEKVSGTLRYTNEHFIFKLDR